MTNEAPLPTTAHFESRDCLIQAALRCFAKYGYDATSIRLIASMAGKNSSLISYYFKGKEGLYREVFRHLLTLFGAGPVQSPASGQVAAEPLEGRSRLHALIRRILIEVEAHFQSVDPLQDAAIKLFLSEVQFPKEEVKDLIRERMEPSVRELRACIQGIRPDLSPAEIDFWGITIQGSCVSHALRSEFNRLVWTATDPSLPLEDMATRLTNFAYHGLQNA
ncbi:transcriptional regulator [Geothrix oryzae]|uniref:Transcriptional regulator n=1 Tax=Geothrix oryzae TaxID=2927975 RepID=A0ABN6UZ58_9BACT|nr:TetR/AcrR family transcriptional regulator [Geothrix oryzae]BDU69094.1 transcriptional regulator [Geothrix oryzae]